MTPLDTMEALSAELEKTRALLAGERSKRRRLEERMAQADPASVEFKEIAHAGSYARDLPAGDTRWFHLRGELMGFDNPCFTLEAFRAMVHPSDRARVMEGTGRTIAQGLPLDMEYRIRRPDGTVLWLREQASVERDSRGNTLVMEGKLLVVSRRRETEFAREGSPMMFQKAFHATPDAIIISSLKKGLILDINEGFQRIFGYRHDEVVGKSVEQLLFWKAEGARRAMLRKLKTEGRVRDLPVSLHDRNREPHACLFSTEVFGYNGKPHLVSVVRDITAQKHTEAELKKSRRELAVRNRISDAFLTLPHEEMFDRVVSIIQGELSSPYGLFGYINEEGALVCPTPTRQASRFQHTAAGRVALIPLENLDNRDNGKGTESVPGRIIFPPDRLPGLLKKLLETEKGLRINAPVGMPEAHLPIERMLGAPIRYNRYSIGVLLCANAPLEYTDQDLDFLKVIADHIAPVLNARLAREAEERERKRLKEELQQAHKIESLGTLAGGIAHDFNNILSPIMIYSEMMSLTLPEHSPHKGHLEKIYKAGTRARDLVQQILTFSRQSEQKAGPLKIVPVVKECIKMLRSVIPTTVEIRRIIEEGPNTISAHPTQIHQILMNLSNNAAHAMRTGGGVLEIGVRRITGEKTPTPIPAPCLLLSVGDTGHGIDPAIADRIFDPYFTTKARGDGTGLGLSVVHGIVQSRNGAVEVHTVPGKGTTFNIFLPLLDEAPPESPAPLPHLPGGKEHILIVDDERAVIEPLEEVLKKLGYTVTACPGSMEALERFTEAPDRFDLMVTDMTMPHMTGTMLAEKVFALRPDLPVILCTGFSELIDDKAAKKMGIRAFVLKPLILREMARTIREIMDTPSRQGHGI